MLMISVSPERRHATAACRAVTHFVQGQTNGISEVIDLVAGLAGASGQYKR